MWWRWVVIGWWLRLEFDWLIGLDFLLVGWSWCCDWLIGFVLWSLIIFQLYSWFLDHWTLDLSENSANKHLIFYPLQNITNKSTCLRALNQSLTIIYSLLQLTCLSAHFISIIEHSIYLRSSANRHHVYLHRPEDKWTFYLSGSHTVVFAVTVDMSDCTLYLDHWTLDQCRFGGWTHSGAGVVSHIHTQKSQNYESGSHIQTVQTHDW